MDALAPRRWLVRGLLGALVAVLLLSSAAMTLSYDAPRLGPGAVESPANGTTVVTSQGWHANGYSLSGRPARLAAVGPNGTVAWTHDGPADTEQWFYDVDPLPNGNLLVVNPVPETTVVYEYDPETGERAWTERFDLPDVHDVDLIDGDELLVAGINYDENRVSRDSVFVYNRTRGEVTWEWHFADHYSEDADSGVRTKDWTHVNDVDKIGDGEYLVSPRNLDQVIVVNRSTNEIDMRLGADGDHDVLYEQHNPTYLESENGTPTILVADSENDRIVEYARTESGEWTRTWNVGTDGLSWPRDADRLPNGNTLVVDTMNQRVFEMTPEGDVVWEFHAPWAPYDVERVHLGDEPGGPTIRDLNASGSYDLRGSSLSVGDSEGVAFWIDETFAGTPIVSEATSFARTWAHVTPWIRPVWMTGWEFLAAIGGGVALAAWGLAEAVYQRRRIRAGVSNALGRVTGRADR
jgi:hypothetical protein